MVIAINAVNFVDGLDGLAAGVVGIGAAAFFLFSYQLANLNGSDARQPGALCSPRWRARASGSCRTTSTRPGCSWATRVDADRAGALRLGATLTGQYSAD